MTIQIPKRLALFYSKAYIDNLDLQIQLEGHFEGSYDQNNALVLPSKKRKTKVKNDAGKITKILSKKQRKRLEKVVEKKKKKENVSDFQFVRPIAFLHHVHS